MSYHGAQAVLCDEDGFAEQQARSELRVALLCGEVGQSDYDEILASIDEGARLRKESERTEALRHREIRRLRHRRLA